MKKTQVAFLAVLTVALAFTYACKKKAPPVKLVAVQKVAAKGTLPTVTFNHDAHKKWAMDTKKNCKFCHHKGKITQKCNECHKGKKGEAALHKNCIDQCHVVSKKGPQKSDCVKCHKPVKK